MAVDERKFEIWGECEAQGIEKELIDHSDSLEDARYLVGEYLMAFQGWDVWYK